MISHHGRLYALALALVVFFLAWAVVAARPWATASPDPRLRALAVRQAQIARVKAATAAAAAATAAAPVAASAASGPVQVVNLPPAHVVTRTS